MARPTSAVVLGLALCVLAAFVPAAMFWMLLHLDEIGERVVALGRRCHVIPQPRILTYDPPIEQIVADLRRLSGEMAVVPRGTSAVRRRGLQMAYDDKLGAACQALQIVNSLKELPDGIDREFERIRIEAALQDAGLRWRPSAS